MLVNESNIIKNNSSVSVLRIEAGLKEYLGKDYFWINDALKRLDFYIAGGSLLSIIQEKTINDIDIYMPFPKKQESLKSLFELRGWCVDETHNTITFSLETGEKVQLINSFVGTPEEVLSSFDYVPCMIAYSPKERLIYRHEDFYELIEDYKLVFNSNAEYPVSSLRRLIKYAKKGYNISLEDLYELIIKINELNLSDLETIKKHFFFYSIDNSESEEFLEKVLELFMSNNGEMDYVYLNYYKRPNAEKSERKVLVSKKVADLSRDMILSMENSHREGEVFLYCRKKNWEVEREIIEITSNENIPNALEKLIKTVSGSD